MFITLLEIVLVYIETVIVKLRNFYVRRNITIETLLNDYDQFHDLDQ